MPAAVPIVEVADDAHAGGVRRPNGEVHAVDAVDLPQLGPKPVVTLPVPAFAQQVAVEVGQQVWKGIRIVHGRRLLGRFPRPREACTGAMPLPLGNGQIASKSPAGWIRRMGRSLVAVRRIDHPGTGRRRQKRPDRHRTTPRLVDFVRTKQLKRILMSAFNQLSDRFQ